MDSQNAKVIIGILRVKQKLIKSNIESHFFDFVFIFYELTLIELTTVLLDISFHNSMNVLYGVKPLH